MTDFANYNTSIPSLMSPTYSVGNAYSLNAGNYGMGYGTDGTVNSGYMGGMVTPMANIPVGQFNADYLLKNDNNKNNYYTRPIATFKKQDDTGTILGIGAAALGITALLAACCKGKAVKPPVNPPKKREVTEVITDPSRLLPSPETVTKNVQKGELGTKIRIPRQNITERGQGIKPGTRLDNPGNLPVKYNPLDTGEIVITNWGTKPQRKAFDWGGEYVSFTEIPSDPKLLTCTSATQTGKLNLGPIESYLPQGNKGFTLPEQRIAGFLPSPQTVSTATQGSKFIKYPSGGARCNEHSKITGDMLRAEFGKIGMNIDTKAFAALKITNPDGQRYINDIVMNGTPGKLQAITCDPKFEHLFSRA